MNNAVKINKFLIVGIVLLFGLIIAKLIYVSASTTIDGINIGEFALSRTTGNKTLYASRGSIYDCSGEVLAENVNSYTVIAYLSSSVRRGNRFASDDGLLLCFIATYDRQRTCMGCIFANQNNRTG